jgi:hypothetical protein
MMQEIGFFLAVTIYAIEYGIIAGIPLWISSGNKG